MAYLTQFRFQNQAGTLRALYVLLCSSKHGIKVRSDGDGDTEADRRALHEITEYVEKSILPVLKSQPPDQGMSFYEQANATPADFPIR